MYRSHELLHIGLRSRLFNSLVFANLQRVRGRHGFQLQPSIQMS